MGLIDRFRDAISTRRIAQVQLMTEHGTNFYAWQGTVYDSDVVRACMRPKVKEIGKLVGKHVREALDEQGNPDLQINPSFNIRMLLEEPNPLMSGQQFQEKMAAQLCLNNNAFALIVRNEMGTPVELYPIIPSNAEAEYTKDGRLLIRFTLRNGKILTVPYDDLIHLRQDYNENDIFGSPLAPVLTPLLDVVTTTDQSITNAIKNSSVVKWLLKFSNSMRPDDLKKQATDFANNYLASESGLGVAAVDAKADATQIKPTDYVPNALQMDKTRDRIYALFNTNDRIVHSMANEEERGAYFDAEVEPVAIQLNLEYTRKLFTRRERGFGNKIVFEASAWTTASISTKLNLLQMVDRGALTPNEWRGAFNLGPIPGGDKPIRRLDTATVADGNTTGEEVAQIEDRNKGHDHPI